MQEPLPMKRRYERRFTGRIVVLPWWKSIWLFLCQGVWLRQSFVFDEVFPGDPGYDTAPYAESFVSAARKMMHG